MTRTENIDKNEKKLERKKQKKENKNRIDIIENRRLR